MTLEKTASAHSLLSSPRRLRFKFVEFYPEDGIQRPFVSDTWESPRGESSFSYTIVLLGRSSGKGYLSMTLGKPLLCTLIVQVSPETKLLKAIW